MKKMIKTPFALALSAGLVSAITGTVAQADGFANDKDIFAFSDLTSQSVNKDAEGKCGEGKCGEGKCGENK